ncbi:G-type lectin S-receptor-like serine/threonine-protein kinase At2g19130 [Ziziphus jujuba]|uniref:Receptor-like serine/threonine-protein kinase n=1 Tax=Ziziphus jujuba TaxID=326968 RepID=A0A6P4A5E1_ZIZJJ|nr:G-type lectin S-receptor-like serine/threonine-protein kinase At2g19130 [Ziziphus jujuba]
MDKKNIPRHMVLVLFAYLFLNTHTCLGADSISANQSISGDQTIESAGGVFVLGFFKPGNSSNSYYIGIWYKEISEPTTVWVANRERPISDRFSSVLRISDVNLVLFDESKIPIWSTNIENSTTSVSVNAVLQDDGNFVLKDGSNSPRILWQSFEHPTNTWLPGCKFGYNNITKTSQRLISWKNAEDPSPGLYSLELDTSNRAYTILWNRSKDYWTSGPWTGQIFDLVPEMTDSPIFECTYISNINESYFIYYVKGSSTKYPRAVMDVSGQIKLLNLSPTKRWDAFWSQPRQQCEVPYFCGAYGICNEKSLPFCNCLMGFVPKSKSYWDLEDYSNGCQRKSKLNCDNVNGTGNGERDKFVEMSSMSLPEARQYVTAGSEAECESTCLNNCSCTAYAFDSDRCSIWIGELLNLKQVSVDERKGETLYVRLAALELRSPKKSNGGVIVEVVGGAVGSTVLLGLIILVILRQRKKIFGPGKAVAEASLVAFDYRYLQIATNNFSEKLGRGGFGSVFKGKLNDSTVIAVKQLDSVSQGEKQFRAEVSTLGTIQHVNLVRLHGFCSQGSKKLLVYNYMPNGSLDSHIFETKNSEVLNWETRYRIALGTARGLCYLHEECRECIIHCDIKPDNVLLDAEFCPKVSDFGLAKLVGRDFSRVLTTMRGTRGYIAPEWISGVAITAKADVYSFGMMLFELISGRRNSKNHVEGEVSFFPIWAASKIIKGCDVFSLLDQRLQGNADPEELTRVCRVACWCIQYEETQRPSMGQIVQILEGIINVNLPPLTRSFDILLDNSDPSDIFFPESSSIQSILGLETGMATTTS